MIVFWVSHYVHVAELLYGLLKKFEWNREHAKLVQKLKEALVAATTLRKAVCRRVRKC